MVPSSRAYPAGLAAAAGALALLLTGAGAVWANGGPGLTLAQATGTADQAGLGARAAQDEEGSPRISLAKLRSDAGLKPVEVRTDGPLAEAARAWLEMAERPTDAEPPDQVPEGVPRCYCNRPELQDGQVRLVSPKELLSRVGIQGNFAAWVVEAESLDALDGYEGAPLLLDPRLSEVTVIPQSFTGPGGTINQLVIFGRLEEGGFEPQAVPKEIDAAQGVTLRFISSPSPTMRLERKAPARWRTVYEGPSGTLGDQRSDGFEGLQLTEFPTPGGEQVDNMTGIGLAIGARYRLTTSNGRVIEFSTKPASERSWAFKGKLAGRYRKVFLREVKRLHPTMRRIAGQIDGYTTVSVSKGYGSSMAGPLDTYDRTREAWGYINFSQGMIADPKVRRETVAHEIAHIVEYFGIGYEDLIELNRLERKSKRWKRCNGNRRSGEWLLSGAWPCTPEEEVRAEQITFAVTGGYDHRNTGYGTPKLVSGARMRRWLSDSFALISLYQPGGDLTYPGWREAFCEYVGCGLD